MAAEENERLARRDEAFFKALALNKKLTRHEFNKNHPAATPSAQASLTRHPSKEGNQVLKQRYTQKLIEQSGFKSKAPSNFKNPKPEFKNLYTQFDNWCKKFPTGKNLVLHGPAGTGKTYSTHIIANVLMEQGFSVLFITAFGLVERFKKYVQSFNDETQTDALFECDLLIIDDLGVEPIIKNISQEYLYNVINERLVNDMRFIITTNLDEPALKQRYDQRIVSRVLSKESSVVIEFNSKDLRLS